MPIYEPGLEELVQKNVRAGRLRFTASTQEGVENRTSFSSPCRRPRCRTGRWI
jgi:UDP-glucose 6-dehydrogenase